MQSTITKSQKQEHVKHFAENGKLHTLFVNIRYDDECGNGHNSFSITGSLYEGKHESEPRSERQLITCGCIHEDIEKHAPEFAPLIKWHLVSSDGPMHYLANTMYHASNRDYNGLLPGEKRQIKNGKTGVPAWHLVAIDKNTGEELELYNMVKNVDAATQPECPYSLSYEPWCIKGEGKARDFDAARSCAVWPEATDECLGAEPEELKQALLARLPSLMKEFKRDMEKLGFIY